MHAGFDLPSKRHAFGCPEHGSLTGSISAEDRETQQSNVNLPRQLSSPADYAG